MSIQAITTPSVASQPVPAHENNAPTSQPAAAAHNDHSAHNTPVLASGITITRVDQRDYPDGYSVTTTYYANKASATKTAPKPPSLLVSNSFDPANGGQLSALLSAQEQSLPALLAGANPYAQ